MREHIINLEDFKNFVKEKMTDLGLISCDEEIILFPYHQVRVQGELCYHYIVTRLSDNKKFFLKILKDDDRALHCNHFLRAFQDKEGNCPYPLIISSLIDYCNRQYYFYTFSEGETLEELEPHLLSDEWERIADKLKERVDELSTIHAPQYSDRNAFVSDSYSDIMKRKIMPKLKDTTFHDYPKEIIMAAHQQCMKILDSSNYSQPTLLHMDIKPANIIYNTKTSRLSLIDFELARFGDIDYGWAQILLTKCKSYGKIYENYVYPRLTSDRLSLEDAMYIPKFQCYLFYQAACNLIYYNERQIPCPKEMKDVFEKMLNQLAKG